MDTTTNALQWERQPKLRRPVLITAFEGWNDGGEGPSRTVEWLVRELEGEKFASLDPEAFYVFTENRPTVHWVGEHYREVTWQTNDFYHMPLPGAERDAIVFHGTEPNLKWRTYAANLLAVARHYEVELIVTLGAYLADVLYTLPVQVNGFSSDPLLVEKFGLKRSSYEGPTGIVGALADFIRREGMASLSLWAAVPYYISIPNPKAVQALLEKLQQVLDMHLDLSGLERDAEDFDNEINDVVAKDPSVAAYVRELKKREFLN